MSRIKNAFHDVICGTRPATMPSRNEPVQCAGCGKFIPYDDMAEDGPARFHFEPLSEFGPEVSEWTCRQCVEPF